MDNSNNWRPTQAGEPPMENADWRTQLQPDSRQRIVNKIMETLKRHLPFSGQEGLQELKKIAVRFEEKIYSAAINQSDYLRKISLKMLTMENKSNPMPNPMQSSSAVNNMNSPDPALQGMQSQVNNPAQLSIPLATNNQSQALLGQNTIQNGGVASTGLQGPSSSLSQNSSMTNVNVQNPNMQNIQNISGISQNSNAYANSQRQQQQLQQQPQNSQQQQFLYQQQQQLQQQIMKQKFQQQGNISQFQQQPNNNNNNINNNLLQSNQLQSSQQSLMQPPAIQQNQQQPSVQQSTPPVLQQSVLRQQRQQPTMLQQPSVLPAQQQQQQQQPHLMQQNQLNNITDMQQQRLIGQQNNNLQQQQMMMSQPNNLANMQQQLQQHMKVSVQQPAQQNSSNLLQPSQSQQSQSQQMVSNMQSQQMNLQQQQPNNNPIQPQQRIQTSGANLLQQQNLTDQQKQQIFQSHRPNPEASSRESDKVNSAVSSLSNVGNNNNNIGQHHQQTSGALLPAQSLAIGTPGISASPLLAEFTGTDGNHGNNGTILVSGAKSSIAEQPLERLLKAVKSMSPQALSASVSDIGSVVSMIDRIAGSAPGNGSRAAVGEDLVAMTKCRLQARNFISQDGSNNNNNAATRKMKRYTSAMPLNVASSAGVGGGSINDSFKNLIASEVSDLESTATSNAKKPRLEANHALVEEIREINQRLIYTVVDISDEDIDPTARGASATDGHEGTVVKCSLEISSQNITIIKCVCVFLLLFFCMRVLL